MADVRVITGRHDEAIAAAGGGDRGSALVMAVLVSVIVFVLGAAWVSVSSHESSASGNDRRRQQAIDAAMAGLVVANSALTRNPTYANSGVVPFPGGGAEFEINVIADPPGSLRRIITSVAYAPTKAASVKTVRSVQQVVDLVAIGFTYAVFSEGSILTGSSSTVIGNIYDSHDITLGNSQDFVGDIYAEGNIVTGSNQKITGSLHANASISVTSSSTSLYGSGYAIGNITTGGTIRDTAQAGGTIGCAKVSGSCLPGSPPPPIPVQHIPTFVWDPSNYSPLPNEYTSGAAFVSAVANQSSTGVFHIEGSGSAGDVTFSKNDTLSLSGNLTIVASGSIVLPGNVTNNAPSGQVVQLTVISTAVGTTSAPGTITPSNNFTIPATVRTLIYTRGAFDASNSSTFTGALYTGGVTAGAHLAVTYASVTAAGFDWSAANAQSFTIRNVSTREISNTF